MKRTISTPIPGLRTVPTWTVIVVVASAGWWYWQKRKAANAQPKR